MAIAFASLGTAIATTSGTAVTITLTTSVPIGAHIVLGVCDVTTGTAGITSPSGAATDTNGNTYTRIVTQLSVGLKTQGQFLVATSATSMSSGNTITYTRATGATTTGSVAAISACVVTGISTTIASGIDTAVNATATTSSSTPSLVSGSPVYNGNAFLGYLASGSVGAVQTFTRPAGWTTPPTTANTIAASTNAMFGGGHLVDSSGTRQTWNPTVTAPSSTGEMTMGVIALISSTSVQATHVWYGRPLMGAGI